MHTQNESPWPWCGESVWVLYPSKAQGSLPERAGSRRVVLGSCTLLRPREGFLKELGGVKSVMCILCRLVGEED